MASGVMATFPVFAAVLAAFSHRQRSCQAAVEVLRGMIASLFGFVAFFVVVSTTITELGIPLAFAAAVTAAIGIQTASFACLRGSLVAAQWAPRVGARGRRCRPRQAPTPPGSADRRRWRGSCARACGQCASGARDWREQGACPSSPLLIARAAMAHCESSACDRDEDAMTIRIGGRVRPRSRSKSIRRNATSATKINAAAASK